jgi:hypothetical protein
MKYAKLKSEKFDVKVKRVEELCLLESNRLYLSEDIDFSFDHCDTDVKTVYVREYEKTVNPVEHKHLKKLQEMIQKEVDERWYVGIIWSDPELIDGS